jgi:endonuclease/exonuclease/phosphatase family metal-dependent hydrolase
VPKPFVGQVQRCEVFDSAEARAASDHLPLFATIDL